MSLLNVNDCCYHNYIIPQKRKQPDDEQKSAESPHGNLFDESKLFFDTKNNYCPPKQVRERIKGKMNSPKYITAAKSLKSKMEKDCPEKFKA